MILDKEKKIKPYYKDYRPLNIYKGKEKITGYKTTAVNSNSATFNNTYNDFIELRVNGKAEQKQYEGYNLLENLLQTQTLNGVTFTVNEDKSVYIKGTASVRTEVNLWSKSSEKTFILKKGVIYYNNSNTTLYFHGSNGYFLIGNGKTYIPQTDITLNKIYIRVEASETVDKTIYPMLTTKENLLDLSKTQTFTQYGKTVTIENYKIKLTCEKSTSTGVMCIKITNGYDLSFNAGGAKWQNETFIKAGNYSLSAKKTQPKLCSVLVQYTDKTFDLLLYGDLLTQTKQLQNKDISFIMLQFGVDSGQSGNNELFDIQLIDNTVEKPYEPFTNGLPVPNLDNPQEIKTVDKIGVNISSVNLFDGKFSQGSVTATDVYSRLFTYPGIKILKNTKYTFSTNLDTTIYRYAIANSAVNYPNGGSTFDSGWKTTESFTFTSNNIVCGIAISKIDNGAITPEEIKGFKFQLVEGTEVKSYFPFLNYKKENILPTNEELASLPNGAKDEIRENKLIKRVQKILIDENSMPKNYIDLVGNYCKVNYNFSTDSKVKNVTLNTNTNYLCNRLSSKDIYWSWAINKKNWYLENNHLIFSIPKNIVESQVGATNKEKITNYLKANPIVFYAELEVQQEIAIDKIKSLPLTTKVDIKTNLDTEIAIKCKEME